MSKVNISKAVVQHDNVGRGLRFLLHMFSQARDFVEVAEVALVVREAFAGDVGP